MWGTAICPWSSWPLHTAGKGTLLSSWGASMHSADNNNPVPNSLSRTVWVAVNLCFGVSTSSGWDWGAGKSAAEVEDSVTGILEMNRVRQFVLSALGFLNLTDVHRQEMGSEGLWLVNQSINCLEIAKFSSVMWFLVFQTQLDLF